MQTSIFEIAIHEINGWRIGHLPTAISTRLPSRGLCLADAAIHDHHVKLVLEPDGRGSHWFRVDDELAQKLAIDVGDTVKIQLTPTKDWPEPNVPADIQAALEGDPDAYELWNDVTPMARWDWIRWIVSTHNPTTREKRIHVTLDKLHKGTRRPCCFNRAMCCEPHVSKGGVLLQSDN
ncbi:YdeI/OmpD-associated family protein [Candidatus Saccharibacteria bacterium]|nr:YdeI/OmpD-associated family protein [Candidatus Saccharibacteria bacterium]